MTVYSDILTDFNYLIFKRLDNSKYKIKQTLPGWFSSLCLGKHEIVEVGGNWDLDNVFPYIDFFINDARERVKTEKNNLIVSGIWSEDNVDGTEYQLCVYYYIHCDNEYIIIENKTPGFNKYQNVMQKARDIALVNEKLQQEINRNQRVFQSDIEKKMQQSMDAFPDYVAESNTAVMVCKNNGDIEMMNQALIDIYKLDSSEQLTRASLLEQWMSEAEEQYPEIKIVLRSGANWEGEFKTRDLEGCVKWIRLTIKAVYRDGNPLSHFICIANNIEQFKSKSEQSEIFLSFDSVTKLPNRNSFWIKIKNIIKSCEDSSEQIALLCIDLDFFKQINNDFGYSLGDSLLKIISDRIVESVKDTDYVAHMGGDEFAVIFRKIRSIAEIGNSAKRIKQAINCPIVLNGRKIRTTCSMGSVLYPMHGHNEKELMHHADLAMYYAKELGRNQHQLYNEQLDSIKFKSERYKELHDAIELSEFFVVYQPQINLGVKKEFRLEALVRWKHKDSGLVFPCDFIESAERSGLIVPLGGKVLNLACEQARSLLEKNIPTIIAVNVSPKQLKHPGFFSMVKSALDKYQLPAEYLEVEITESSFLEGIDNIIPVLQAIRTLGVSISLDDFGSGFSSFNYLRKLPLDVLKIDCAFIMELETSEESRVIATMIIKLAKALGLKVIAEGVETRQQLEFLSEQGCDIVQGYYFYQPLPADKLVDVYQEIITTRS